MSELHNPAIQNDVAGSERPPRQSRRSSRWRMATWALVAIGLLLWLLAGTVQTTTYSYNQFTDITYRYVIDQSIQDIWAYQAQHLPTGANQTLLGGAFVMSAAVVVMCVIGGSWLLLVTSTASSSTGSRRKRRTCSHTQSP